MGLQGLLTSSAFSPRPSIFALECLQGDVVAVVGLQQDGDAGEGLEDAEQFFVGGVVGQEVAHVDLAQGGGEAGEGDAAAAGDADVFVRVLAAFALAVEGVVELRPPSGAGPAGRMTGPYSWLAGFMCTVVTRGGAPGISPVSGAPWPRLAQAGLSYSKPCSRALPMT